MCECEESKKKKSRIAKMLSNKEYFITPNPFWDMWFQKLFAQFISVKIWIIALITVLLSFDKITELQFASILGIVMAAKGVFSVADVWKREGSSNIIDKV